MNKFWLYAVVIALVMTAIVERCQGESFEPITEHSEIKAYYKPIVRFKIKGAY